ncbi:MAG: ribose 5-phosphate isomerase B [Nitrospirae bacterium]|nr:ribose 5-phosphate isomerase B [Nitrospirota bacterium]
MPNESALSPRFYFGSDHAGRELKDILVAHARNRGLAVLDLGTYSDDSVDYPDFAEKVGHAVVDNPGSLGVLVCGTGIGMSIAANKIRGIRAALLYSESTARLARQHNNANVIAMGGREISPLQGVTWFDIFAATAFEGGRHGRRLEKIARLESP